MTAADDAIATARQRKARLISAYLVHTNATAEQVRNLDSVGREAVARLAKVNPPSAETWTMVVAYFESYEKAQAAIAGALPDDPFDGLGT